MSDTSNALTQKFLQLFAAGKLSSTHIFENVFDKPARELQNEVVAHLICQSSSACGHCHSCQAWLQEMHPDVTFLSPGKQAIKVDEIRQICQVVYTTPKLSANRIVVVNVVENLSRSAANALLKVLEEPSEKVFFLLFCRQLAQVLPTIRSRCIFWRIAPPDNSQTQLEHISDYFDQADPKRQILLKETEIKAQLEAIYLDKASPIDIAQAWQQYPLCDLLWLLYWIHAQLLRSNALSSAEGRQVALQKSTKLIQLINEIKKLTGMVKKNRSINALLVCERLLMMAQGGLVV